MLANRLRLWSSIKPSLVRRLVFAGSTFRSDSYPGVAYSGHVAMEMRCSLSWFLLWISCCKCLHRPHLTLLHLFTRLSSALHSQQTQHIVPMLTWCWPAVYDVGPASTQHSLNESYLLGLCILIQILALWNLNLPLSSSSTTGRELLSQCSTCRE